MPVGQIIEAFEHMQFEILLVESPEYTIKIKFIVLERLYAILIFQIN